MKYLAIYDKDETEYNTQRLGFLENAEDVCISQSINGDYTLEFSLPKGDEKRELIAYERKVGLGDKIFRIKTIDGLKVTAVSLMQDACRHHIQYIEDMIGEKAYKIFNKIFSGCPYVEVLSDDEYDELGLEKVDNLIDFFEQSKKTPIGCLKLLMETLNKYKVHSEIYINNNKIGLVKRLGKDRGVVIDTRFHAGYNESLSKYVFELYDKDGNKNMYIDDDGNLTMRGVLKTGLDNEARTVIDKNGIRSYNKGGGADGLWANFTESETDGVHTIALYDNGEALFKVFKGTAGTHISLGGEIFLISDGSTVKFGQTLMYCGSEVANKADIEKLQSQINAMKSSGTINLG